MAVATATQSSGGKMTGITIAIATYNRAAELAKTLAGLGAIDRPATIAAEVLVIDNRCTDDTAAVVAAAARTMGLPLRLVREHRQGLSHARNCAVVAAKYDVIAFLDDDVDVDKNWLSAMAAAFADERYAAVGGRALLVFPVKRPAWLGDRDEASLTKVDLGDARRDAAADELYGLNLAIRRRWIGEVGGFRRDLGRVGANLIGDEEYELLSRICAAGGKLLYEPAAVVGHRVGLQRLRRRWFWQRCFHGCRGAVRAMPEHEVHASELLHCAYRTLRIAGRAVALLGQARGEPLFHETVLLANGLGRCVGLLGRLLGHSYGPDEVQPVDARLAHAGEAGLSAQ